jgi:hypothetical protein
MEALTFAQSAALVGIPIESDADSIVVQISPTGSKHRPLRLVHDAIIDDREDVYFPAGGFLPGSVSLYKGRTKGNLKCVYVLVQDCDLADYIGTDKAAVYGMPQDEIEALLPAMVNEAHFAAQMVGLPITVIIYSGHGIQVVTQLTGPDTDRIADIDAALKVLIKRMNEASPRFVDAQASDAGTRLFRAVGTLNTKSLAYGQPARRTRILDTPGEVMTVDELLSITKTDRKPAPARITPIHAKELPAADADDIVNAITPHWTLGQKHALSLAIAGMLAKAGVPEPQALSIVTRLSSGDDKPWDRAKSVNSSYDRYRAGGEVRGYFALRDFVSADAVDYVDGILERFRSSNAPRLVMKAGNKKQAADEFVASMQITPLPRVCFDWPWIGEYVDLMAPACEAPDQFHLATGLTIAGATLGRSVCTRYVSKSVYGNLYHMLVGSAGTSRKDTAIRFGVDLPFQKSNAGKMHTPIYSAISDVGSTQGLIKELTEKPNTLLYITEYQRLSQQAHRTSTATILPTLTAAWDTPFELQNKTVGTHMVAKLPYLSILAAVQPGILAEEMTQSDIQSGYATRWLYVPGQGKSEGIPNPPEIDEPTAYALYQRLIDRQTEYSTGGGETRLYLSPDAAEQWDDWYHADRKRDLRSEDEMSMTSRLALHIRKIALIYAALEGASEISGRHLTPAVAYVEWCWNQTQQLMQTWGVGIFNAIEIRIEAVLNQKGPITRRLLYQQCKNRRWSTREFTQVLDGMIRNGIVVSDPHAD